MNNYLKRKIDQYLLDRRKDPNKKPLIIKGARQVGKTKTVEQFGKKYYKSFIEINFVSDPVYKQIIENGYQPDQIIKNISRINSDFKFLENNTLIFFDEIQDFPDITTALKFFAIEKKYDVICSGSLLGINYKDISSVSVGYKTEIKMKSLDFEEYLWALGYNDLIKEDIFNHMINLKPFSESKLTLYNDLFLDYCIIGGMPEVVNNFVNKKRFEDTLELQKQIIIGYESDIKKYAFGLDKTRIKNIFLSIPYQLSKENKKFQISKVKAGAKFQDYQGTFEWLLDAGIINISRALQNLSLPLKGNIKIDNFIVYYADNGLLLSQLDEESCLDFKRNKNFGIYKGGLFENIIAEALVKQGYELCYYKKDNSTIEEEFLIRYKDYIIPIEVKAGNNKAKSLNTLISSNDYKEIKFGFKIIKGNIGFNKNIFTFPHFCTFLLKDFINNFNFIDFVSL